MIFMTCGINHKTAPITLREQISFSEEKQIHLLNSLLDSPNIHEALILSTCNRSEFYCITDNPKSARDWFIQQTNVSAEVMTPHLYTYVEQDAMKHLLEVGSGLDSMMIGEPQILGQLKKAYQQAKNYQTIHTKLRFIFQFVFNACKQIRHQSGIGCFPSSIAYTAAQLIQRHIDPHKSITVFLIGSGDTTRSVAKYLAPRPNTHFLVTSRTLEHAESLAKALNGEALPITEFANHLFKADVVISATACPLPFITKEMLEQACQHRDNAPMLLLDLALPRDIMPEVKAIDSITLYNIDELQIIINQHHDNREEAAKKARILLDDALKRFHQRQNIIQASDIISDYRATMKELASLELTRATARLEQGTCHYEVLQEFTERLLNKITHHPTVGLRQAAMDGREELLDLARYLFSPLTTIDTYENIS